MKIWALSDLHLPSSRDVRQDVFGGRWGEHDRQMAEAWDDLVHEKDVVLSPGDFSWAMRAAEVEPDLQWLDARPGRKVMVKGNHDFWWPKTHAAMRRLMPPRVHPLKKTAVLLADADGSHTLGLFGCRGGDFRAEPQYGDERTPEQIEAALGREERELRLSLDHLGRLEADAGRPADLRICLFHYPPIPKGEQASRFSPLITASGAEHCVYGHLHGQGGAGARVEGDIDGVRYRCASCDLIDFRPVLIAELGG